MSDSQPIPVDLVALHEAIKAQLRAYFPESEAHTVDYYARPGEKLATPAILFELEDISPDDPDDIGTEQWAATLGFSAMVVVGHKGQGAAQLGLRVLTAKLAAFVRGKQWGQPIGPGKLEGCMPAEFVVAPNSAYHSWRVSWSHTCILGDSAFIAAGSLPQALWLGWAPDIGVPHVADYQLVFGIDPMQVQDVPSFVDRTVIATLRRARVAMRLDNVITPEGEFATSLAGWSVVFQILSGATSDSPVYLERTSAAGQIAIAGQAVEWAIEGEDTADAPVDQPLYFSVRVTDAVGRGWIVAYGTITFSL